MTQIREQVEYDFQAFSSRGGISADVSPNGLGTISVVTPQGAFWPMLDRDHRGEMYVEWCELGSWPGYMREGWDAAKWALRIHGETKIPVEPLLTVLARCTQRNTAILPGHLLQAIVERMPK